MYFTPTLFCGQYGGQEQGSKENISIHKAWCRVAVTQSVWWWATGLITRDWFLAETRDSSLLHCIQISTMASPTSYSMGTTASFTRVISLSYPSSSSINNRGSINPLLIHPHGMDLNWLSTETLPLHCTFRRIIMVQTFSTHTKPYCEEAWRKKMKFCPVGTFFQAVSVTEMFTTGKTWIWTCRIVHKSTWE